MPFTVDPMFPGDLFDAASRFAADVGKAAAGAGSNASLRAAWQQAAAMSWPVLCVDEARGGAGGTLEDLGAVIEACARHASGLPLVRRCAVVPAMLMAASTPAADDVLRALGAGKVDLDMVDARELRVSPRAGGGVRVDGLLGQLDAAVPATHLLLAADDHLLMLSREVLPAPAATYAGIDGARGCDVMCDGLVLDASAVLASGAAACACADAGRDIAALATAIEIAATLGALVEHTIVYLETRVQFGVALSSFQVLRHKAVDLYVQYESASVLLARLVHDSVAAGRLDARDAALVKLYLGDLARRGAESSIQLHGGMGMTAELPAARLACRLLCAEFEHGDRLQQLARLEPLRAQATVAA